ncbi:MAG: hypothetical protein Q8P80_04940 [Candidatus Levybacteria bacterium]|nr:hypothetical protein [Candidatus Levybacteria bacterium]
MKKPAIFITFLGLIVIFLTIVQVVVSNRLSTTGNNLWELEEKVAYYEKQNAVLKEELLTVSSLNNIASTAGQLGFVEDKSQIFLSAPLPLAVR